MKAKRKYSKKAQQEVKKELHRVKKGTAKSGKSGKKVTSKKQGIAIALSKARKKGMKVPKKKATATPKKKAVKKTTKKKVRKVSSTSAGKK